MTTRPKLNGEWIRWLALIAFMSALHFGDNRYVTKAEYSVDQTDRKDTVRNIREALVTMDKSIALLETTRRVQDDHETRIRVLEHSKLSYEIKTNPIGHPEPALFGSIYSSSDR